MNVSGNATSSRIDAGSVQQAVQIGVLKKANDLQGQAAMQLLQSVPSPTGNQPLASSGQLGTRLNTYA